MLCEDVFFQNLSRAVNEYRRSVGYKLSIQFLFCGLALEDYDGTSLEVVLEKTGNLLSTLKLNF